MVRKPFKFTIFYVLMLMVAGIFFLQNLAGGDNSTAIEINIISKLWGPVKFTHDAHTGFAESCASCHHHSKEGETPACSECHSAAPKIENNLEVPGLKGAFHRQCMDCHRDIGGPMKCSECHEKKLQN
jgi:hypothetical protein